MHNTLSFSIYFSAANLNPLIHDSMPEGPGWYIYATRSLKNEAQEIIPHVRLTPEEVGKLGLIFDNLITDKPLNWTDRPGYQKYEGTVSDAVKEANESAKEIVQRQLAGIEAEYHRLDQLRARAEEFK